MAETKTCSKCSETKPLDSFSRERRMRCGRRSDCKGCGAGYRKANREKIRACRKANREKILAQKAEYHKTKKGFLVSKYKNMRQRVAGVRRRTFHLYAGCKILPKDEFYAWSFEDQAFQRLFAEWEMSGYVQRLCPSVDRVDPTYGYELWNMQWVTFSENCRRSHVTRYGGSV